MQLVMDGKFLLQAATTAEGVSPKCLRDWYAKSVPQPVARGQNGSRDKMHDEIKRIRLQLKRAEMKRDILIKGSSQFAVVTIAPWPSRGINCRSCLTTLVLTLEPSWCPSDVAACRADKSSSRVATCERSVSSIQPIAA